MVVWIILHKVFILTRRSNHFPVQYWFFAEKLFSQNSHFHFPVQYWFLLKNCFSKFSLSQTPLVKEATACWPICGDVFFYICDIQIYTYLRWYTGMENCENQISISQSEQETLFFWLVATLTSVNKTAITFTFDHFSHHLLQPSSHCPTIQKEYQLFWKTREKSG